MKPVLISWIARCSRRRVALLDDRPHLAVGAANRRGRGRTDCATRADSSPTRPCLRDRRRCSAALRPEQRNVAESDERHAVERQHGQRDARGVAGAARRLLAHEDEVERRQAPARPPRRRSPSRRRSRAATANGPSPSTYAASGRPASGCRTLGSADCIRLPWPAARMTTSSGNAIGQKEGDCGDGDDTPAPPVTRRKPCHDAQR